MLVKWNPYKEIEHTFDEFFGRDWSRWPLRTSRNLTGEDGEAPIAAWKPAVNVREDSEALHIEAQLPGIDEQDVHLSVTDRTLELRGERKAEHEDQTNGYLVREATYGSFARSFSLPSYVDPEAVKARYERGVLKITVPKQERAKPRVIPIEGK